MSGAATAPVPQRLFARYQGEWQEQASGAAEVCIAGGSVRFRFRSEVGDLVVDQPRPTPLCHLSLYVPAAGSRCWVWESAENSRQLFALASGSQAAHEQFRQAFERARAAAAAAAAAPTPRCQPAPPARAAAASGGAPKPAPCRGSLAELPHELLGPVLAGCGPRDLGAAAAASRELREAVTDGLWRDLCKALYPQRFQELMSPTEGDAAEIKTWHEVVREAADEERALTAKAAYRRQRKDDLASEVTRAMQAKMPPAKLSGERVMRRSSRPSYMSNVTWLEHDQCWTVRSSAAGGKRESVRFLAKNFLVDDPEATQEDRIEAALQAAAAERQRRIQDGRIILKTAQGETEPRCEVFGVSWRPHVKKWAVILGVNGTEYIRFATPTGKDLTPESLHASMRCAIQYRRDMEQHAGLEGTRVVVARPCQLVLPPTQLLKEELGKYIRYDEQRHEFEIQVWAAGTKLHKNFRPKTLDAEGFEAAKQEAFRARAELLARKEQLLAQMVKTSAPRPRKRKAEAPPSPTTSTTSTTASEGSGGSPSRSKIVSPPSRRQKIDPATVPACDLNLESPDSPEKQPRPKRSRRGPAGAGKATTAATATTVAAAAVAAAAPLPEAPRPAAEAAEGATAAGPGGPEPEPELTEVREQKLKRYIMSLINDHAMPISKLRKRIQPAVAQKAGLSMAVVLKMLDDAERALEVQRPAALA